uniref:Uncharacterized protein n=1 Tax=Amphimedon queenslandica TaxID=400682 RepID=A0A1X7UE72_AMPQE
MKNNGDQEGYRQFVTQCVTETLESYSLNGVLNLIGRLSCRVPSYEALLLLITEFCNDINPRLCREAMKALAITNAVTNNGRGTIPHSKDPSVTLLLEDAAFIKTCGMVTDGSLQVCCLSTSTGLVERFLLQTLDKKQILHLCYVKSDHDRACELHTQGSWDTGQW